MTGMFFTPPANQGQIVEVSYAVVGERVVRKHHDRSDGTTTYADSKLLNDDDADYWNAAPANRKWRVISAAQFERMVEEE